MNPLASGAALPALKSLQILRAIAAISVVYYHVGALPHFGSFGVDIFFVMSGFFMTMVLARKQDPFVFAVDRITRIVPLYWILTSCLLVIAWLAPHILNSTTANLENYAKSLMFVPYFKEDGSLRPLLAVGWTLNYEMFFYLCLWSSLLLSKRFYLEISGLLVIASFVFLGHWSDDRVLYTFFKNVQLLEFVLGILSYKLFASRAWRRLPPALATAAALGAFGIMAAGESLRLQINGFWLYGLPSTVLVLAMLNLEPLFQRNGPIVRLWTQMGDASYATYLSHYYVVELVRKFGWKKLQLIDPYTPLGVALIVLASLVLGNLIYKLIDRPLMRFFKAQAFELRLPTRPA